jgi:hypothetical protein
MLSAQTDGEGEGAGADSDVVEGANRLFTEAGGVVLLLLRPKNRDIFRDILSRLRVGGWDMTARAIGSKATRRFQKDSSLTSLLEPMFADRCMGCYARNLCSLAQHHRRYMYDKPGFTHTVVLISGQAPRTRFCPPCCLAVNFRSCASCRTHTNRPSSRGCAPHRFLPPGPHRHCVHNQSPPLAFPWTRASP